nr:hypothetical protein GCM10020063_022410 [Dactylosporangium thailandense]
MTKAGARGRGLLIAACLLFAALVVARLGDPNNTEAAGISICTLETVALVLHLRAARRVRAYRYTSVALGLQLTLGVAARQILASRENYSLVVTDSLTGLANRIQLRGALHAAAERRRRTGAQFAVLLLDLNGFKKVNDTHGHEAGDRMLIAFADVLRDSVREGDVAARLGGDEFAVVLADVDGPADATVVAERILAGCRPPLAVNGHSLRLRASIGIATSLAGEDDLLHRADIAMAFGPSHRLTADAEGHLRASYCEAGRPDGAIAVGESALAVLLDVAGVGVMARLLLAGHGCQVLQDAMSGRAGQARIACDLQDHFQVRVGGQFIEHVGWGGGIAGNVCGCRWMA